MPPVAYPVIALGAFLAVVVVVINYLGRRLDKHETWLRTVDVRVSNLHKARHAAYVRSLQIPGEPPPLSEAATTEVTEDMLATLLVRTKGTDDGNKRG